LGNSAQLNLPGTNLKDYRTADGKLVIQQMIEMTKSSGGGAFEYDWINPETKEIESKISYFKKIPDFDGFIGAGYYKPAKPRLARQLCTKQEAMGMVEKAMAHVEQVGLEQALADFKRTEDNPFRYRELYVFVYDYQGNNLANSAPLKLPNTNLMDYRSPDGKLVVQEMVEMTKTYGGGAFEYDWVNPETDQVQSKISYFKKIPDHEGFIGCGYYRE
jgi:signal transduction histidine kinase